MKASESKSSTSTGGGWGKGLNRFVKSVQQSVRTKQEEIRIAKESKDAGKVWDAEKKEWVFYFIDQEFEKVQAQLEEYAAASSTHSSHHGASIGEPQVADREYYDLLGVSTSADDVTIRKAYFKEARKCHPDKNPDDPEAHAKFQKLGHAYQVLSNPESRAAYDRDGKPENSAAETMDAIDPFVFFNVMFGSTLIEPYVGELWIASMSDSALKDQSNFEGLEELPEEVQEEMVRERLTAMQEKNELTQRLRQIKCAQNLRQRIADYNEHDPQPFIQSAREEAIKIVQGPYGALYLITIGFAMQVAAEEFLGFEKSFLGLSGHFARSRKNASAFGSNFKLLGAGIKAANAGSRAMQEAEKLKQPDDGDDGELVVDEQAAQKMADTIEGSLPTFLELVWAINKRDIQSTLQKVCKKVFEDASVPKEMRLTRAEAVRTLGREFQLVGNAFKTTAKDNFDAEDIKARAATAAMTTMAKAQGQEVTEKDQEEMIQQAKQMSLEQKSQSASEHGGDKVQEGYSEHSL